jgi:hypothetical protein
MILPNWYDQSVFNFNTFFIFFQQSSTFFFVFPQTPVIVRSVNGGGHPAVSENF